MRTFMVSCVVIVVSGAPAADVLWDQSAPGANNFVDQEFGNFPDYSSYMVTDVVVPAGGWVIEEVSTFFTVGSGYWGPGMSGRLNIFPKTGVLPDPGDDPTAGALVAVDVTSDGIRTTVTASGLSEALAAGEYWVGLTPVADFGVFGKEYHLDSPLIGGPSAWRNPTGAFGYGTDWHSLPISYSFEDAAILILGIPEPDSLGLLGLAGLAVLRRR